MWAPSVHNTQPWRFTAVGQQISLHADAGRQLMVADPDGREMMISCGAALFTARLALRSLGYIPETSVLPDPGQPLLVARVSWRRRAASDRVSSGGCSARCRSGGHTAAGSTWCRCRRTCWPQCCKQAPSGIGRRCASSPTTGSRAALAAAVETAEATQRLRQRVRPGTGQVGATRQAAPGATGCRTPPTRRVPERIRTRTSPAGTSPTAADGVSAMSIPSAAPGPLVSCACWPPPTTARWTG